MKGPNYVCIYVNKEMREHLDRIMSVSGLTQAQILSRLVKETLPKAKMKTHTYTVQELTFE